jgi:site-specific DNA recombinase
MNAIYVRVSTDEQARTGFSLQDQLASCRNRLLSLGLTSIQEYIDDGYSGEFLERPALDRLRDDLRAKIIKVVIVYDPDRLSRNLTNQLLLADDIEKAHAQLMFVTGDYDASPEGRLFFSIRGAISAFEKEKIRERSLRGKRTKAKLGKIVINNNPYGFDWDAGNSTYIINEKQAEVVRLIYSLSLNNYWGSPKIAMELSDRGILNHNNKPFNAIHVHRILKSELYSGTAYSQKVTTKKISQYTVQKTNRPESDWIAIPVPAIVTHKDWEKVQQIIIQNSKLSARNTKREYLLSGLLRCGVCGMGLVASHLCSHDNTHYYYRCVIKSSPQYRDRQSECNNRYIPVDLLENTIWDTFTGIASGDINIDDYLQKDNIVDNTMEIQKLTKKRDDIAKKQSEIMKWYRANIIDSVAAESELQSVTKELSIIDNNIANLQASQKKIKQIPIISLTDVLNANTCEQKRKIIIETGIKIHVRRIEKNFQFWFTQPL